MKSVLQTMKPGLRWLGFSYHLLNFELQQVKSGAQTAKSVFQTMMSGLRMMNSELHINTSAPETPVFRPGRRDVRKL